MRGLLIVLCALVTAAAALAGGCGLLITGVAATTIREPGEGRQLLMIAGPVLAATAAVAIVNIALITALARGRAPRRSVWFLLLAIMDFAVASLLVAAGVAGRGPVNLGDVSTLLLPAALALKGLLTLLLPARPPRLPPTGSAA
jgi:hypothetical protein